ncbi:MAG: hypothetical protein JHC61_12920 [Burkholderiaceae bacterium]|nr:hypothetical protein [Burkholderiaceae bacterium]
MTQPNSPKAPFEPNKKQKQTDTNQENKGFDTDYESDPDRARQSKGQTIGKDFNAPKPE